ncbi:MAG: MarR family winged helix-turn-helix transcriptional regulator [Paracoccaceae bacterium]
MAKDNPIPGSELVPIQQMITFRTARLSARLAAQAARILKESSGLTLMQWRILIQIHGKGSTTQSEMVRLTQVDKAQVSRTLKHMLEQGLVASEVNESDHRVHFVRLTDKGADLLQRAWPTMTERRKRLHNSLSAKEQEAFFDTIQKIEAMIDEMEDER